MRRALLAGSTALVAANFAVALPAGLVRFLSGSAAEPFVGIDNFSRVRPGLWRGAAPTRTGYRELAGAGVETVIDLRAERGAWVGQQSAAAAGLHVVPIPIRDGQTPSAMQLDRIARVVAGTNGFIHCGAGVGRTGTVVAALQVASGESPFRELRNALAFGPLSLEQQVFVLTSSRHLSPTVWLMVVASSRVIDSPRRLWSRGRELAGSTAVADRR